MISYTIGTINNGFYKICNRPIPNNKVGTCKLKLHTNLKEKQFDEKIYTVNKYIEYLALYIVN
jgi:hypothetical protein